MSSPEIEAIFSPYEAHNYAHQTFRREFKYLNALYYLIVSAKAMLQEHLESQMVNASNQTQRKDGNYALGIVTHSISASQFQGVVVPKSDAEVMVRDFDGFVNLLNKHCVIAAHRAVVDFTMNLLTELDNYSLVKLSASVKSNLRDRRLRPSDLAKEFQKIGEPIHIDTSQLRRLQILGETRNILEHNDGKATETYIKLLDNSSITVNDQVKITSKEVGEAFALIESTVTSLNQRILNRYKF